MALSAGKLVRYQLLSLPSLKTKSKQAKLSSASMSSGVRGGRAECEWRWNKRSKKRRPEFPRDSSVPSLESSLVQMLCRDRVLIP